MEYAYLEELRLRRIRRIICQKKKLEVVLFSLKLCILNILSTFFFSLSRLEAVLWVVKFAFLSPTGR